MNSSTNLQIPSKNFKKLQNLAKNGKSDEWGE